MIANRPVQSRDSIFTLLKSLSPQRRLSLAVKISGIITLTRSLFLSVFTITICAVSLVVGIPDTASADTGDNQQQEKLIKTGRAKAQGCTRCHGREGMARVARKAKWNNSISTYVIKQLLLFRGGRVKHEIMNAVAKPLSDADIYAIAIWYESVSKKQEE